MTYYGPKEWEHYVTAFWNPSEFLSGEWSYEKQQAFNDLYNLNIAGWSPFRNQFDSILDARNDRSYFERYGLDYKDVKDPRKLVHGASPLVYNLSYVSDNVKRLYK